MSIFPSEISLLVFDFDGVMTDNAVLVRDDGTELVRCDRSDGWGLARLRETGLPMLVLSTESNPVVEARCKKIGLPVHQGVGDKAARLREVLEDRSIDPQRVVYVGNDVNDLGCLELVGTAVAVADAHPSTLLLADLVLGRPGGHGAVRELCDLILAEMEEGRLSVVAGSNGDPISSSPTGVRPSGAIGAPSVKTALNGRVAILPASGCETSLDAQRYIEAIYDDLSIAVVCCPGEEQQPGRLDGRTFLRELLATTVDPRTYGSLAVGVEHISPGLASTAGLLRYSIDLVAEGDVLLTSDPRMLDPGVVPPPRWLEPREVEDWVGLIDAAVVRGLMTPQEELTAVSSLLRRAVLLPDLAECGPYFGHALLAVNILAERADNLCAGREFDRTHGRKVAVLPLDFELDRLRREGWWEELQITPETHVQRVGQQLLLAGRESHSGDLGRFEVRLQEPQ